MYQRIVQFLDVEIWKIKLDELTKHKAWGINVLRILVLTIREFAKDKCSYRASALTFYTLLTIVPVLALAFGIAQGFGLEAILEKQIRFYFESQEVVMNQILNVVHNLLSDTREELVAGIGVLVLLWSVLRILANIENTMNVIWQAKKPRTIVRRIVDYSALMIIAPILVIISSGLTVFIARVVTQYTQEEAFFQSFSPIITFPLKILPYAIVWMLMTFLYLVMPNKRVKIIPALIGGIIAGTAYQVTQWGYITFQVGASNYNAIYGSFAALPLFLIWLQLSWTIVLFGAELSYSVQHVHQYEQKAAVSKISPFYKRTLTLLVVHLIIKRFDNEKPAITIDEISMDLGIPYKLLREILEDLLGSKIINQVRISDKIVAFQPARDINKLTIHHIFELMDKDGANQLDLNDNDDLVKIEKALTELKMHEKLSTGNLLLKEI